MITKRIVVGFWLWSILIVPTMLIGYVAALSIYYYYGMPLTYAFCLSQASFFAQIALLFLALFMVRVLIPDAKH